MNISDRFRELVREIKRFQQGAHTPALPSAVGLALSGLEEMGERVGDVPRIRLEAELTPVLLKAHSHLDRARLLCEEKGESGQASAIWDLEQRIYYLLNEI